MLVQLDNREHWDKVILHITDAHTRFLNAHTNKWCYRQQPGYDEVYIGDNDVTLRFKQQFSL